MARRRPSQYEQFWQLSMELDALVTKTVAASVKENSPQQMVEEAFRCFGIDDAVPEICEELTKDGGCTMDEISKAMLGLAKLLRDKGGSVDAGIQEHIACWTESHNFEEFSFPEVLEIVKGLGKDAEAENDANDDANEDEDEEDEEEEVVRRARNVNIPL
jgi:hypothetical protein